MVDKDELLDHNYDGIQEFDNDLPRWWVWLFWITIIVAVVYPFIYDFGPGEFASETVDRQVAEVLALRKAEDSVAGTADVEGLLLTLAKDPAVIQTGSQIYATRCMACHLDKGQGLIGPNLTDEFWIHGGKISEIKNVVLNGVLEKGMLAWKDQLTSDEVNAVVAFVWSIRGSNPPNPKAPEGAKVAPG